jgi:hypothetical protein
MGELFNLLFGGQRGWVEAAFLVCLFWAALGHPDRIRSPITFRIAVLLFAVSLIAPTIVNLYLAGIGQSPLSPQGRPRGQDTMAGVYAIYLSAAGPALFMLSFLLAIDSVIPRGKRAPRDESHDGPPARP